MQLDGSPTPRSADAEVTSFLLNDSVGVKRPEKTTTAFFYFPFQVKQNLKENVHIDTSDGHGLLGGTVGRA